MTAAEVTVLDASALLAYLRREPGHDVVEAALASGAMMSSANYSEVLARLVDLGEEPDAAHHRLVDLGLVSGLVQIVPFSPTDAVAAAALRQATKPYGLSLGDRACLATALRVGATALTADRTWLQLQVGVTVRAIRSPSAP